MFMIPTVQRNRNLMLLQAALGPEPKCLDPGELRSQLQMLAEFLEASAMFEAGREMTLMRLSGVSSETALGPFLDEAYSLFVSRGLAIRQVHDQFQMALALLGTPSDMERPGRSIFFACRNTRLIQSRLRTVDQRLKGLLDVFRQRYLEFDPDAQRLRRLILLQQVPPGPRSTTVAEQAALALIRTILQEFPAIAQLMREALQEIVQTIAPISVASPILRRLPAL